MKGGSEQLHRTWPHSGRYIPRQFIQPVQRFMQVEASAGIVMLVAAIVAIAWANSPWADAYFAFWDIELHVELGAFHLTETLGMLVNDGLMVIFFFVVGLEIKRELVLGELSDPKAAALPVVAAVGGMVVPALVYVALAAPAGPEALRGWGVPVATDIAFALGVVSIIGRKVPSGAKLFLLALAIADDIGGILIIALFYTDDLRLGWLAWGIVGLAAVWLASKIGVRSHVVYVPLALFIWFSFLESGVHATIAGVALGFLTPALPMYSVQEFDRKARQVLDTFPPTADTPGERERADYEAMILADISREAVAPLNRAEHRLQTWSSFVVIPIFALANAGVRFDGGVIEPLLTPVALGVAAGLVIGKTVGISIFAWLAVRLGWGKLPRSTTWRHVVGVAATAGIGFTVALFITVLAFRDPILADQAKVGIFAGSIVAGALGASLLASSRPAPHPAASEETEAVG